MSKFILIGIPSCGKSTLGKKAAEVLGLPFFDTDIMAIEQLGIQNPIDQIRANINGSFVDAQRAAVRNIYLREHDSATGAIISTGAEVALMAGCAALLKEMGKIIHVRRSREAIFADLTKEPHQIIWEEKNSGTQFVMQERAVELYEKELPQYEKLADFTLENNGNEEDGLEKLLEIIRQQAENNQT